MALFSSTVILTEKTTDITAAGVKKELKISHMYVWECICTKRKKEEKKKTAIEEDRERTIFLLTFYL